MSKTTVPKRLMSVHHSHRHGNSIYLIRASEIPSEEDLISKLGIDFEPDRDEFIEVHEHEENEPTEFP